jgi:uncharacterized membrane protein
MRSKAGCEGYPIVSTIIPFPVAFLHGSFFFDLAGRLADRPAWWTTGAYLGLVGVLAALVAAVLGFIDYSGAVPPNSSAKRRGTKHMLVSLTAVALFAGAWVVRGQPVTAPSLSVLALEGAGVALLTAGGLVGAVLRNCN